MKNFIITPKIGEMRKRILKVILFSLLLIPRIHNKAENSNHITMKENIIDFGNETYAIQINGYTSLVVIGSKSVLVTDPANSQRAQILKSEIASLTKLPIKYVVLSHEHYDHIGGTEVFDEAKIVGHEFMETFFGLNQNAGIPRKLDITFKDSLTISLDKNKSVELHFYAPGDGVTTTIIHMPQQEVTVATDLFMTDYALFPGRASMDDVNLMGIRNILNKILTVLKPKHVLNGHSPNTEVKYMMAYSQFYNDLYEYCNEWIIRIKNAEGAGAIYGKVLDFAESAQMPEYMHWKNYRELKIYVRRMVMSIHHGG